MIVVFIEWLDSCNMVDLNEMKDNFMYNIKSE